MFVYNWFHSLVRGARASANPWQVGTLEWTVASPPPHYNFDEIPIVRRGPHELSDPRLKALLGRDWVSQTEIVPDAVGVSAPPEPVPSAVAANVAGAATPAEPLAALLASKES